MRISKNTLIILIILVALVLIATVVVVFNRRIEKIESGQRLQ